MKKNFKYYIIAWAILLAIFNVIVFTVPNILYSGSFWIGYVFITLAFCGQLLCTYYAFKDSTKEKLFLNLPLITVSYVTLIISVIAGTLCMVIPQIPNWVGIIICVLILGITAFIIIKAKAAAEIVSDRDDSIKKETQFIKSLAIEAESLESKAKTDEAKAAVKKVYDAIRYSDPMSNAELSSIESQIQDKFAALSNAVADGSNIENVANETISLVAQRNNKCKTLK